VPRIKKSPITDNTELQPLILQEAGLSKMTPISAVDHKVILKKEQNTEMPTKDVFPDIQTPVAKMPKEKFKQLHIKDTYWLENDIYQTLSDLTEGKKSTKALIINEALKDYLKKNKLEIRPLRVKGKKD